MATLTVTLTEELTLNGAAIGGTNTLSIASIDEVTKRIVTCTASQTTTVLVFNATVHGAAGAVDVNDCKYIRVTNLDSANTVELAMVGASDNYQVTLAAGHSHILGSSDDLLLGETDTDPSFGTMEDLASIQCNPGGNAVSLEVFTASA